jgi:prepilin-type N-terminal cleavage/methylation domain-containing protein
MRIPPRPRLTAARRRAYSLIELLAVMAILSALAGLTVGSLSPVKANALTAGGNQIADLLTLARQNSLSRHAFTAVVIKSTGDARYSAFCLFELTRNDDGTFSNWTVTAPWKQLPEGIRFDPRTLSGPPANFVDMSTPPSTPSALPPIQFRGGALNVSTDVAYQVFAPDGTLTKGAPVRLRLVEGAEDGGSGLIYTGRHNGGQPLNYYDIVVVRETGQAKVERY